MCLLLELVQPVVIDYSWGNWHAIVTTAPQWSSAFASDSLLGSGGSHLETSNLHANVWQGFPGNLYLNKE